MSTSPQDLNQPPGYDFGTRQSAESPLTDEDLRNLEQTIGWTNDDRNILLKHSALFQQQAEPMVDSWRSVIGAQPHLAHWFLGPDGKPDDDYKARVKRRFVQWVVDVATRPQRKISPTANKLRRSSHSAISSASSPSFFPSADSSARPSPTTKSSLASKPHGRAPSSSTSRSGRAPTLPKASGEALILISIRDDQLRSL